MNKYTEYLKNNPKGYWFRRKLYGWGWYPATWQGWVILLAYILLVFLFSLTINETSPAQETVFTFFLPVTFLTLTLIRICYKTGEKPKWQWGIPREESENQNRIGQDNENANNGA